MNKILLVLLSVTFAIAGVIGRLGRGLGYGQGDGDYGKSFSFHPDLNRGIGF